MSRNARYSHSFQHSRWGNLLLWFYPAGTDERTGEIEDIPFPDTCLEVLAPMDAALKELPIGLMETPILKVKIKMNELTPELRTYINSPEIQFGSRKNIWVMQTDRKLPGGLKEIFIGTQKLNIEKKNSFSKGKNEKEFELVHVKRTLLETFEPGRAWSYFTYETAYEMRDVIEGIDLRYTDQFPEMIKQFSTKVVFNSGTPNEKVAFDFGYAKFVRISDIFKSLSELCNQYFAIWSRGIDYQFEVANPYALPRLFMQSFERDSHGDLIDEEERWILACYHPEAGRPEDLHDCTGGFFMRPQTLIPKQGGYNNMWDMVKHMYESVISKAIVGAKDIKSYPVFASGAKSKVTATVTDFKENGVLTESYCVLRSAQCKRIDGMTEDEVKEYEEIASGTASEKSISIERMLLTNAPSNSRKFSYEGYTDSKKYLFTPFPENRIYYFAPHPTTVGLNIPYRVHHHCEIPISNEPGDTSASIVPLYVPNGGILMQSSDMWKDVSLIQRNSTLPLIAILTLLSLFGNPKQCKLEIETSRVEDTDYTFCGQEFDFNLNIFAADMFDHLGTQAFLLKSQSQLWGDGLDKVEYFLRGI